MPCFQLLSAVHPFLLIQYSQHSRLAPLFYDGLIIVDNSQGIAEILRQPVVQPRRIADRSQLVLRSWLFKWFLNLIQIFGILFVSSDNE